MKHHFTSGRLRHFITAAATLLLTSSLLASSHREAPLIAYDPLADNTVQIICTTHSAIILDTVPPEARFYLEKNDFRTIVLDKVTSAYAAGRLAEKNSSELDIYVEDDTTRIILESVLNENQRARVNILPIGSHSAVCRQLASCYRLKERCNAITLIDGDKEKDRNKLTDLIIRELEFSTADKKKECKLWIEECLHFMPGDIYPEKWLLKNALPHLNQDIADNLRVNLDNLRTYVSDCILVSKHSEFYDLGRKLNIREPEKLKQDFSRIIFKNKPILFEKPLMIIDLKLS